MSLIALFSTGFALGPILAAFDWFGRSAVPTNVVDVGLGSPIRMRNDRRLAYVLLTTQAWIAVFCAEDFYRACKYAAQTLHQGIGEAAHEWIQTLIAAASVGFGPRFVLMLGIYFGYAPFLACIEAHCAAKRREIEALIGTERVYVS